MKGRLAGQVLGLVRDGIKAIAVSSWIRFYIHGVILGVHYYLNLMMTRMTYFRDCSAVLGSMPRCNHGLLSAGA